MATAPFIACGPDPKPQPPCDGPTYELLLRTGNDVQLPDDTRLNVRYGGNHEGESYGIGQTTSGQAVFCTEETSPRGGAPGESDASAGAGGAGGSAPPDTGVWALSCQLYTQGPARIDVTATGYEAIEEQDLTLDERKRCRVEVDIELQVAMDTGT